MRVCCVLCVSRLRVADPSWVTKAVVVSAGACRLVEQVLGEEITDAVAAAAFEEMDADAGGSVDFDEFVAFFGL